MNKPLANIDAVLFDLDGVLINSLPVMKMALTASLKDIYDDRQFDMDELFDQFRHYLGMGFTDIMDKLALSHKVHQPFCHHSRYLSGYVNLYPDIHQLLTGIKSLGLPMGIATGKDKVRTEHLLNILGIDVFFENILCSDMVANAKPAPDMAILFCQQQSVKPENVLFIGDSSIDIQCGKAAGCQTGRAIWGYGKQEEFSKFVPEVEFETPNTVYDFIVNNHQQGHRA